MNIPTNINPNNSSMTTPIERYPLSGNMLFKDAYNNLSFQLTGVMLATTIMTSASTIPPQPISVDSAVSTDSGIQSFLRTRRSSQAAIAAFSAELQRRSQSLSREDAQILRKVILSKSQPGVPRF
ncbi:hypothetical protein JYQ62_29825 [Nostoc sp. UHCC 0702]|nr:hypothetical protein JYQ62_29825 [Nostoc sp. UHCC 0702]